MLPAKQSALMCEWSQVAVLGLERETAGLKSTNEEPDTESVETNPNT